MALSWTLGPSFSESILRRVTDLSHEELSAALHALTSAELLYQEALYPEAEYSFKHPLTREVAYRSQLAERRARVHADVARAIEETDSEKLGERAALLAYHWEQAGDVREAAKWHRRAAEWVGANNPTEALRHWGSVRQHLDTLPETAESLAQRAAVRAQIMTQFVRVGDPEDHATALFQEAASSLHGAVTLMLSARLCTALATSGSLPGPSHRPWTRSSRRFDAPMRQMTSA
jgi:adenylate cyclase